MPDWGMTSNMKPSCRSRPAFDSSSRFHSLVGILHFQGYSVRMPGDMSPTHSEKSTRNPMSRSSALTVLLRKSTIRTIRRKQWQPWGMPGIWPRSRACDISSTPMATRIRHPERLGNGAHGGWTSPPSYLIK